MKRVLLSSLLLAIVLGAIVIPTRTPSAFAADDAPCGPPFQVGGRMVQRCPLWRGDVPVFRFENGVPVEQVGQLNVGGDANWFECQFQFPDQSYPLGNAVNNWWAFTQADNGQWGWVPEVFFAGGGDFEADAGLALCFAA